MKKSEIIVIILISIWEIFWLPVSIYALIAMGDISAIAMLIIGLLPIVLYLLIKRANNKTKIVNQKVEIDKLLENAQNYANQMVNQARNDAAVEAQQMLDKAKEETEKEAKQTLSNAKIEADKITSEAMQKVKQYYKIIENAKKESQEILNNATQEAENIKNEAIQEANKYKTIIENSLNEHLKDSEELKIQNQKLEHSVNLLKNEYKSMCTQIELASKELLIAETTIYVDDNTTSEEIKSQLAVLNIEYGELVRSDKAIAILSEFGYESKRRFNDNKKQILRCFNSESKIIINSVTATNADKMRGKLTKSFQTINAVFSTDCLAIDKRLLELRLKELDLVYFYHRKKEQEQEEQKAIREQMLEEEKIRREIEREKAKVEKEETQFKNEINKLMKYLVKATEVEKQLYVDKIKELEDKVKLLEKDKENILEREQNTRAGYVYVISNIGSFGENIYKIGMTRRLEPMDRVKELGDASVPFEFDVHAMIFSEDAPALETILHNTFKDNQVNLVNPRKEFYNVSLADIEKVVKENYNATVTFTQIAKATQYRESQKIKNNLKNNEVFV